MNDRSRPTVSVRPWSSEEWRAYRDLRLRALSDSPDAFGSTLEREQARPDTDWQDRLTRGDASRLDLPLVAERNGEPVGMAWVKIDEADLTAASVYQMWVDPEHRGAGLGLQLITQSIEWARAARVHVLELGVTCGDTAATRLYTRVGFEPVGEPTPLRPGSTLLAQTMRLELGGNY